MTFKHARQRKAVMAKWKLLKYPRVLIASTYQIGKTNLKLDRKLRAMKPGKRVSKTHRKYYEYRRNRSDLHPAQHL